MKLLRFLKRELAGVSVEWVRDGIVEHVVNDDKDVVHYVRCVRSGP